jgi:hypothetical protein
MRALRLATDRVGVITALVFPVLLVAGCSPSGLPTDTIVKGDQATADDPAPSPAADNPSTNPSLPVKQGDNIARGRPYTWNVPPDYSYCTDPGDATQLTDGLHSTNDPCYWTQLSTVGWRNTAWVAITVDLGQVEPIQGVSLSTGAGVASMSCGVDWPLAINVLTSDDGVNYYHAGELTSLDWQHGVPIYGERALHTYWTDGIAAHGRFVRIVAANSPYTVADEIEVHRGTDAMLAAPLAGSPITDMAAYVQDSQVRSGIFRRIVLDAQQVALQVRASQIAQTQRDQIESELAAILGEVAGLPQPQRSTFRAVLPLNDLHARVFRALARLWRAQGRADLAVWQTPLWAPLTPTQAPGSSLTRIEVTMMQREFRAGAFNLSNAADSDVTVSVRIDGLPGGTNPPYVTVHEVPWTDTRRGVPVAAALPIARLGANGYLTSIPSGMTRQVWLTFHPTNVAAGTYSGNIVVAAGAAGTFNVPVQLRVSELEFPAQPALSLGGWDYTDCDSRYGMTPANRDALISHLREHFVDTPWATDAVMPIRPNPQPQDFAAFDVWVQRWPGARNYYIALGVGKTFGGYALGTTGFNQAVGQWVSAHAAHWRAMGLNPNQIALLLLDEPFKAEQSARIAAWGKAIRAAEPEVLLWEDPIYDNPADPTGTLQAQTMFQVCDVLCLHWPDFIERDETYRNVYRQQRDAGRTLNFYSACGPARWYDPYSYYRLQAWTCWQEGATAMFYWAFGDNGGASSWNEYLSAGNYTPLYLDDTTVTAGKQMEAIREGVEDYEYLAMLKKRIGELEATGNPPAAVAEARTLLSEAAGRVLNAPDADRLFWAEEWSRQKDRGVADQVRIEILDMLEALSVEAVPGTLAVSPSTGLTSSGTQGGPFSPDSTTWTLSNTGGVSVNWTAAKTQSWVTLSKTGGTLAAGATDTVTVSFGAGANSLPAGSYGDTVTFTNTDNSSGNTTRNVSLTIDPIPTGQLTVTLGPESAVAAGAQWNVDGGAWQDSGATVSSLSAGAHAVNYKTVTGWTPPASKQVTIGGGQTATVTGTYLQQTSSLRVTISPAAAVTAGAEWSVDGGVTWRASAATVNGLPVGPCTVIYKPLAGWTEPTPELVTIVTGQTATATGTYIQDAGGP